MAEKIKHSLKDAHPVALAIAEMLEDACERVEIAGSVRRGKWEVGDIEVVCISKIGSTTDLFGEIATNFFALDILMDNLVAEGVFDKRRKANGHLAGFGPQNKLVVHVESGIPVDIFSSNEKTWGLSLLVRTGPAEFNIAVMERLRKKGLRGHVTKPIEDHRGRELSCATEKEVFALLGCEWIPPELRTGDSFK